uniref:Prolyl 4-hydroxylase alpha subunit Fe(2+) 2OG dioxygenase domain-containing protein n=1 Tax=Moniliophthora roreri TaxID=221103 RepID=A0A0W0FCU5_MONRR
MGERTVVDKEVRDTWEMDASKVSFENPAWKAFVIRVVHDVCRALGVNFNASQPRCELYKLLLYETGSHFLPHVDTEKTDGMFASIIILPTRFTGGDAHLSHGNVRTVFDSSKGSLTETTVLAWYTDVMHEIVRTFSI